MERSIQHGAKQTVLARDKREARRLIKSIDPMPASTSLSEVKMKGEKKHRRRKREGMKDRAENSDTSFVSMHSM